MTEIVSNAITKRPEIVVALHGSYGALARVGEYGVTAIEPYDEYGEMSYVPWFNVWRGEVLYFKFNAAQLTSIEYKQPDTDQF